MLIFYKFALINKLKFIMKKILLLVAFSTILTIQSQAQYDKGEFLLNVGIGAGYYYAGGVPLIASAEWFVTDKISVGPYIGYTTWNHNYFSNDYRYTFLDIGGRGSYHFSELFGITNEKVDVYGGVFLGFTTSSYSGPNNAGYVDAYGNRVSTGLHAGARYYFAPKIAGYGELGLGMSTLAVGLTFRF
jgi:hypothetical protein